MAPVLMSYTSNRVRRLVSRAGLAMALTSGIEESEQGGLRGAACTVRGTIARPDAHSQHTALRTPSFATNFTARRSGTT